MWQMFLNVSVGAAKVLAPVLCGRCVWSCVCVRVGNAVAIYSVSAMELVRSCEGVSPSVCLNWAGSLYVRNIVSSSGK